MQIRKAANKDIPQLSKLIRKEIEYHQNLAGYYEVLPNFDWIAYTREKLNGQNELILVADSGENLAGFIDVRIVNFRPQNRLKFMLKRLMFKASKRRSLPIKPARWGVIEECYIIPDYRRKLVGSQLVNRALEWFQANKISRIELSLVALNRAGEAFWKKLGFVVFRVSLSKEI